MESIAMYSVIIPTYNRCKLLPEAIDSVLLQDYPAIEIIVIDDGSSDTTARMIAQKYPYVRYLYQPNQGPASARNRGIAESTGEFIAFLDSDDIWLENKITLELSLLQRFPEAAMLAGNASAFVEGKLRSEDTFAQRNILFNQHQPRFFDWSLSIMKKGPVCCTSSMTFRKSTLVKLGDKPFDETLRLDEDWDLEFRLFSQFKALLYPHIVCKSRVFNDGTRHFYSAASGQPKTINERRQIWQQQRDIIARYLNNPRWDGNVEQDFQQRHEQLTALLR
jgi:glycosyltransferase involved in cell wall biosynthesis